jgi:glutaryl-CoA dehydrogenase
VSIDIQGSLRQFPASPANVQWDSPFMLDEHLTENERMIHDTACAYAQDKLLARASGRFRNGSEF